MTKKKQGQVVSQQKRERPIEEQDRVMDSLDEIEAHAKSRIKEGQVASLGRKLNLEWSHKDPDFEYYWFIDGENQQTPHDAVYAGWEFERHGHGSIRGQKVVKSKHGITHYLMRMPNDMYKERKEIYNREVNKKDSDLLKLSPREYGGDSKELGKGKAVKQEFVDNPEISPLMS